MLREIVTTVPSSLIARGAGRSYGDAALNGTGWTVLTEQLNRVLAFDNRTGVLRCEAGMRLGEILDLFVPQGWFLPVAPGTRFVTVGGAVAFDIHGKNHELFLQLGHERTVNELLARQDGVNHGAHVFGNDIVLALEVEHADVPHGLPFLLYA